MSRVPKLKKSTIFLFIGFVKRDGKSKSHRQKILQQWDKVKRLQQDQILKLRFRFCYLILFYLDESEQSVSVVFFDEFHFVNQERGEIFFFYRPKVNKEEAHTVEDVQRLYIVIHSEPSSKEGSDKDSGDGDAGSSSSSVEKVNIEKQFLVRFMVMGKKCLSDPSKKSQPFWGFVEMVTTNVEDVKAALGYRK